MKHEKGQVLVILVVGVTALLAFAALAIDGGMYYSDRRYDQNAADSSALAGAGAAGGVFVANEVTYSSFDCTDANGDNLPDDAGIQAAVTAAVAEAQSRAGENNFASLSSFTTESALLAAGHGIWVECVEEASYLGDKYLAVHVMISTTPQSAFAHLFFDGQLRNTVEAVTKVEVPEGAGRGLAIVALNTEGCGNNEGGLFITGGSTVTISESGAHSNACLDCSGTGTTTVKTQIDPETHLPFPLTYMLLPKGTQCEAINPLPSYTDTAIAPTYLDMDGKCSNTVLSVPAADEFDNIYLTPGTYDEIRINDSKVTLYLNPGLYCVQDEISINGKGVETITDVDPALDVPGITTDDEARIVGITIYSIGGPITINGGAVLELLASKEGDSTGGAIPGMLIYVDPNNPKNTVTLTGGTETYVRGTILNPDGIVTINGNSSSNDSWFAQIIADKIFLGGGSVLNITYSGEDVWWGSSYLGLDK